MNIKMVVSESELRCSVSPKWYGYAYRRWEHSTSVFYIIPLNLIVRYAHKIYWGFYRWLKHSGWQDKLDVSYWKGFEEGARETQEQWKRLIEKHQKGD